MNRLRAKSADTSGRELPGEFLPDHLRLALEAARAICDSTALDQLRAAGLPAPQWLPRMHRLTAAASALHDLGKANAHFQRMLAGSPLPQGLRHEWISFLLVSESPISDWLRVILIQDEEMAIVRWAICGHHPAPRRPSPPSEAEPGAGDVLDILSGHTDFRACLEMVGSCLGIRSPIPTVELDPWPLHSGASGALHRIARLWIQDVALWDKMDEKWRSLCPIVKATVIAADVAASSASDAPGRKIDFNWVTDCLGRIPTAEEMGALVRERLASGNPAAPRTLRPFQIDVAERPGRVVLVRAGCGTGKTLAAYLRAARCAAWSGKRLYFCYPTTGTATEGFRDYLFDEVVRCPKAGAHLFHSRADVDARLILQQVEDLDDGGDATARSDSLVAWDTPIACCTVDTVLGLLHNQRRGLYAWPALAQSAFVFDEVHAYDDRLFGTLLRFLTALPGTPALLMTASLPAGRLRALRDTLETLGESPALVDGPADLERLPRYRRVTAAPCAADMRSQTVLFVANTVNRAIAHARRLSGLRPLVYHSRFKYRDRVRRHAELVDAFKAGGPALAVTTQVCEMSLDLSATTLITEEAPVPALIQRLGRLNRRAQPRGPGDPRPPVRPFAVLPVPDPLPYSDAEIAEAREWLSRLGGRDLSQEDLVNAWDQGERDAPTPPDCAWLDGGPTATVHPLRESSPGLRVIMEEDLPGLENSRTSLVEAILPMNPPPRGLDWGGWHRYRGVPVAPGDSIAYDPQEGASWLSP
ncbi:MAG TPA: CRISPR-associated helicase Cas3' [Verrucomicrobiae bacterium]|nr:CRISPR-associated helicase Cas3' [Verrucomicrobiae bacterium]